MNDRKVIIKNFLWRLAEKGGVQIVSFVVSIILARLLDPSLYGTVAIVTVFIVIANVFVDGGMASALIQKKDADDKDFSSVFYFNIILCIVVYLMIFLLAPVIATFYASPELKSMIRVLAVTILISGAKNVQVAYISRNMQFKKFFWSTLLGTIVSAVCGIIMALIGFGVWALIAQQLINNFIDTVFLWIIVAWKPKFYFSYGRIKELRKFGLRILLINLIEAIFSNARSMLIGKVYSQADLAFYNRGEKFADIVAQNVTSSLDSVLFPAMSSAQEERTTLKAMTKRSIEVTTFVIAPILIGIAFSADSFIRVLLTEKWIESKFYLQIFCITYLFYPIHSANINAIKAMGKGKTLVIMDIIKRFIYMALLLGSIWISPRAIAVSMLITNVFGQLINSWPNRKLIGYSYIEQLMDIMPTIISSLIMGVGVFFIGMIPTSIVFKFIAQVVVGFIIYIAFSILIKNRSYTYLYSFIKDIIHGS